MKYFLTIIKTAVIICAFLSLIFFMYIALLAATKKQPIPITSPAIAEYQENKAVRELLSPSVFTAKIKVFVQEKNKEALCTQGVGTAFTVSENGYFITNNHVVDLSSRQTEYLRTLAKKRNVPVSVLKKITFRAEYTLTDDQNRSFPVQIVQTFPKIDLAILKPSQEDKSPSVILPKQWKPVEFRTGSPNIVDGNVVSGKGPFVLRDEPIATMGTPLSLPFTITKGKLGNNTFYEFNEVPFIHFIAPINSGNSGGPLVSLLDYKVIGMTAMIKQDHGNITEQAGAIPFWVIQKALKEVDMK